MATPTEKIVNSASVTALARLASIVLPVVITWGVYAVTAYVDVRFDAQAAASHEVREEIIDIKRVLSDHEKRIGVVEDIVVKGRADRLAAQEAINKRLDKLEDNTAAKIDKLADVVVVLSNQTAAMNAEVRRLIGERP